MFGSDLSSGGGAGGTPARGVDAVIARGQALVDTSTQGGGRSLAWHVEAMFLGDLPALVAAAARAPRPGPAAH